MSHNTPLVKLISYSQPPSLTPKSIEEKEKEKEEEKEKEKEKEKEEEKENPSLEEMVAYCARVSNPVHQEMNATLNNTKLIEYLIKHQHWSPFEMVSICLEIVTTRDIARQILRHRSFSFQEFSQRYSVVSDMDCHARDARLQDTKNRQNSIETDNPLLKAEWIQKQQESHALAIQTYQWALSQGIAKEQARAVLPEGNTLSKLYVNGTLRSWIHYIQLRSANGTQKEHQEVAIQCGKVIQEIFPALRGT